MCVGKLGFLLSVAMISAVITSLIVNVHLFGVINQLNDELSDLGKQIQDLQHAEFQIYGYTYAPGYLGLENKTQQYVLTVWNKVKDFNEAKLVISEETFSVIVYLHPYTVGAFDPSTAEWVVIISSIPETSNETKIAIFRLDYQTRFLKKAYTFSYSVDDELSLEESIAIMEEEMTKDPYGSGGGSVNSEKVKLLGGNYVYSYPAMDLGGTIIVNRYAGVAIFYATTVWDGVGRLIIPEE